MGAAILSLSAYFFAPTLILYAAAMAALRKEKIGTLMRIVGFLVALPSAAIVALMLADPVTVEAADDYFWQASAIGAGVGAGLAWIKAK